MDVILIKKRVRSQQKATGMPPWRGACPVQ